jgi:hypothetical protein
VYTFNGGEKSMRPIRVYAEELADGLGEQITTANKIVADCQLMEIDPIQHTSLANLLAEKFKAAQASNDNFDLLPLYTILVSTGWNKNDDVFDRWYTYEAKATPEDKPFNLEHDPTKIIGHITGGWPVTDEMELISSVSKVEDLPDKFHILTSAVIYRHLNSHNEDLERATKEMLDGIANNEWFVSMEALFNDFDYAMVDDDGSHMVVARNQTTAFLTKHLRVYGGNGVYKGKRIGRLLKNITFSGKGLVKKPANPASVIFNDVNIFKGVVATLNDIQLTENSNNKEKDMSENNDKLIMIERQNADLNTEIKGLRDRLAKMDEEKVQAQISGYKDESEAKDKVIAEKDAEIAQLTASHNDEAKAKEEAIAAREEAEKSLAEATEKLEKIEAEANATARISTLVDSGVDKAEATELVAKAAGMTDEQFELLVEAKKPAEASTETDQNDTDETTEGSDDSDSGDETDDAGEAVADANDLGEVEDEDSNDVAMGSSSEDTHSEERRAAIADLQNYFESTLVKTDNDKE